MSFFSDRIYRSIIPLLLGILLIFGCTKENDSPYIDLIGTIQQQGITTYQYGTHILTNENSLYALKSSDVNLDIYIGETVTVRGTKIEGYPVDGGPDYLEVKYVIDCGCK